MSGAQQFVRLLFYTIMDTDNDKMDIQIIPATDIPALLKWRREVLDAVYLNNLDGELKKSTSEYYRKHLAAGSHYAVIATADGEEVGCGAVCFQEELPSPENLTGGCGYIMDVYVREPFRNKGIGEAITGHLIEKCHKRNCGKIYLETTAEGRLLFENMGFSEMKDMMDLF